MNQSTAMAERLGVDLHVDARSHDTVNYTDRSIPAVWAAGRGVIADKTVNYQAVRHGGGILEDHTPVEFGPTRDDWHAARRFRTSGGTVVTLAERNYLAARSNGVDAVIEDLLHDTFDMATVPGTVKGTSVRHELAMTAQQRQVNHANLRDAKYNRAHGLVWVDLYNVSFRTVRRGERTVSIIGNVRNYTGTVRDGAAPLKPKTEQSAVNLEAGRSKRHPTVKCDSHPDGVVPQGEGCGTCKKCKGRAKTAASRARAAERERIATERKMATIGGGNEWQ